MQHLGPILVILVTIAPLIFSNIPLLECRYKTKTAQKIDFTQSKLLGAIFKTIKGIKADSALACAHACCSESTGQCSLGEYNPQIPTVQCLLLACYPLQACLTTDDLRGLQVAIINRTESQNGKHSFIPSSDVRSDGVSNFKLLTKSENKQSSNKTNNEGNSQSAVQHGHPHELPYEDNVSKISDSISDVAKEKPSAVGEPLPVAHSVTIATTEFVHVARQNEDREKDIDKNTPIPKYDDTVLLVKGNSKSKMTTPSSLEYAKPSLAYLYVDNLDAEKNKTSVGKKGVMNPPEDLTERIRQSNKNVTDSPSKSSILPLFQTGRNNNSKDMEDTVAGATTNIPKTKYTNKLLLSLLPIEPLNSTLKVINETININKSSIGSLILGNSTSTNSSLPHMLATDSETVHLVTTTTVPPSSSDVQILQQISIADDIHNTEISTPFLVETVSATNRTSFVNETYNKNQAEENFEEVDPSNVRAGIHLVVALVIGLLLLFTVVGLVVRRVHDVWQRRHYQRMDFLVDGMYNTVST